MDILAIAALEAFDRPPEPEQAEAIIAGAAGVVEDEPSQKGQATIPALETISTVAGVKRKAELLQDASNFPIDPLLSRDALTASVPPPRMSASLANILSIASQTANMTTPSGSAGPSSSPYRSYIPLSGLPTSSPAVNTSPEATMVYYGPPERLSEDSGLIRCICPYDDDDGFTIQCERCFAWLHGLCVDISPETVPDIYTCPLCVSGGRIARQVEARAARLQQLRKEAEDGLRRQRTKSNATTASQTSSLTTEPTQLASELDEEYELLAKARGLAYQQSFDPNFSPTMTFQHPPLAPSARPAQSPYYQREQLPVQQHILGPSPFLHPPPQQLSQLHAGQPLQQAKRAGSVVSNASNNSGSNKRAKSSSPGGANLPASGTAAPAPAGPTPMPASTISAKNKRRVNHASHASLASIPQNSVLESGAAQYAGPAKQIPQPGTGESELPPPPASKKRRSTSARSKADEKDAGEQTVTTFANSSVFTAAPGATANLAPQSNILTAKETAVQPSVQPLRRTRVTSTNTTAATTDSTVALTAISAATAAKRLGATANQTTNGPAAAPVNTLNDSFLSDDDDSGMEDRIEPWQFEYTPINRLRYADKSVEQAVNELVDIYIEEERENLLGGVSTMDEDDNTGRSSRASPFNYSSRNGSSRPSLLSANAHLNGLSSRNRTASPVPSSGSSTPAYSSSGVASALAPPCLPLILPEPPISPSDFSSKLSVKPLATSSMSLAPPACTPFSGPTCVPSLMNPYPRPTIHGVFTSAAFSAGSLITFMNGEVVSGEQYRSDPINQWHDLGVMKCHTRGIAQPFDLVLDQRRFADDSRFIRNGCHPNVFTKPVLIRKSRINDIPNKKSRSTLRRKVDQQQAVREGGEFELVFALYALQDIAKREELVLPFDWADDNVVHSLHTLLFSPSLVFPPAPANIESETEDDGIPSTSSFSHLTTSQKAQIAQCSKHLYRLSRLASQTCLTLLGTSICACEKRRDCSIAWLWKVACFSESSSARSRGTIQLQDFDVNGLRAACASALATDDRDWAAMPGLHSRASHKKSSNKKRRADLGALIGLSRGWDRLPREPDVSAAVRLQSEEEEEEIAPAAEEEPVQEIVATEVKASQAQEPELASSVLEDVSMDIVDDDTVPEQEKIHVSADMAVQELDEKDDPFSFNSQVPLPEITEQVTTVVELSRPSTASKDADDRPESLTPVDSRPNTATSSISELKSTAIEQLFPETAIDSDSDITEPLPSDYSDNESKYAKRKTSSPVKEIVEPAKSARRRSSASESKKMSAKQNDDMDVDEEEIVRPPKKKKVLRRGDGDKPRQSSRLDLHKPTKEVVSGRKERKTEDLDEEPPKKASKLKTKPLRTGDGAKLKDKSIFGSGLPSFRTKKQLMEKAKEAAVAVAATSLSPQAASANSEQTPSNSSKPTGLTQAIELQTSGQSPKSAGNVDSLPAGPGTTSSSQLDSLFDLPIPPVSRVSSSTSLEVMPDNNTGAKQTTSDHAIGEPLSEAVQSEVAVAALQPQVEQKIPAALTEDAPPARSTEASSTTAVAQSPTVPAAAPLRRVSFQAYKKRVSVAPKVEVQGNIKEEEPTQAGASTVTNKVEETAAVVDADTRTSGTFVPAVVQSPVAEQAPIITADPVPSPRIDSDIVIKANTLSTTPSASYSALSPSAAIAASLKPRLSFAAYRQRFSTGGTEAQEKLSPAVQAADLKSTSPASKAVKAPEHGQASLTSAMNNADSGLAAAPAETSDSKAAVPVADEEQEEGEVLADPNLEPGEVESESRVAIASSANMLGLSMESEIPISRPKEGEPSYTPPARSRSLTPPRPASTVAVPSDVGDRLKLNQARDGHKARDEVNEIENSLRDGQLPLSSNAKWTTVPRHDPQYSPPLGRGSFNQRARGFSRSSLPGSPPQGRGGSLAPASRLPTGPRGGAAPPPWPSRGRASSITSTPGVREAAGGGFGSAASGGSSYRPGGAPPPSAPRADREPPSAPKGWQGPPRGRGRFEGGPPAGSPASRDKGWGYRGGRRGGRGRDY